MAENTSQLNILVKVRDEASAALSRLSGDVSDLGGSLNFAGTKAGILAGAMAAIAGAAVIGGIKAFADAEANLAKMDALLKTIPGGIEKYRSQILQAADTALKFGFDNENAAFNIAKLLKATGNINFALQAYQAAMDLARFKGIGLDEATQALILAFQGGGRMLKQLGIDVDEHASKETILAAVMQTTAGQAEAFTKTALGMWEVFKMIGGEILKVLGEPFIKVFELIGTIALQHFDAIIKFIQTYLKPVIIAIEPMLLAAIGYGMIKAAALAIPALGGLASIFAALFSPYGILILLFAGFIALLITNWDQFKAAGQIAMENIKAAWQAGWNWIASIVGGVLSTIQGYVDRIVATFDRVKSAVAKGAEFVGSGATEVMNKILSILPFQHGGIVTRPTIGLLGEAGAEAVIPLNRLGGAGIGGGGITINLQGDFYTDMEVAERFGDALAKIIKYQLKL